MWDFFGKDHTLVVGEELFPSALSLIDWIVIIPGITEAVKQKPV